MTDAGSYRLLTFRFGDGGARAGLAIGDRVYDAADATGNPRYADVGTILEDWEHAEPLLQAATAEPLGSPHALADVQLLPPVPRPGAIYCAAANYRDHVRNMAKKLGLPDDPDPHELGIMPYHFMKPPRAALVAPGGAVRFPAFARLLDWEIELVAVVGRRAKDVGVEDALAYVAGYTVGDDVSVRDLECMRRPHVPDPSPFRTDFIGMKGFDDGCPLGPWIAPAATIPNPQALGLKTWIDGRLRQDSHTSAMIFTVAEQLSYLSRRVTLFPGDLIMTGTPAGVGAETGEFLAPGQSVRMWIEGIGELTHTIARDKV